MILPIYVMKLQCRFLNSLPLGRLKQKKPIFPIINQCGFLISTHMGGKARRPKADYIRLVRAANHILPDSPDTPDSPDNLDSAQLSEIVPGTNDSNSPFKNRTDL